MSRSLTLPVAWFAEADGTLNAASAVNSSERGAIRWTWGSSTEFSSWNELGWPGGGWVAVKSGSKMRGAAMLDGSEGRGGASSISWEMSISGVAWPNAHGLNSFPDRSFNGDKWRLG